jgi:hypothetical protein
MEQHWFILWVNFKAIKFTVFSRFRNSLITPGKNHYSNLKYVMKNVILELHRYVVDIIYWSYKIKCQQGTISNKIGIELHNKPQNIQCGNFNWNKIHNLDMGDFCKKSRNRSIFVFPCLYFGAYGFCICPPGSAQPPLTFFFQL